MNEQRFSPQSGGRGSPSAAVPRPLTGLDAEKFLEQKALNAELDWLTRRELELKAYRVRWGLYSDAALLAMNEREGKSYAEKKRGYYVGLNADPDDSKWRLCDWGKIK